MTDQNGTLGNEQGQVQGTGANGPWAEDLNSRFEDEAQRQAVDAFLREKVQPYVTQLEQESRPALELYKDLRANPAATYVEITEDLFGEDEAKAISAYLESRYNDEQQPVVPDNQGAQPNTNQGVTDPRIQEMLSDWEERRNEQLYEAELRRLESAEKAQAQIEGREPLPIKDHLFRPFVVAEDGDMDRAMQGYKAFVNTARAELFTDAGSVDTPPPTLGSGNSSGATPPPVTKNYNGDYGAAIEEWANEQLSSGSSPVPAPPTRG
jgi:hypothetical protein